MKLCKFELLSAVMTLAIWMPHLLKQGMIFFSYFIHNTDTSIFLAIREPIPMLFSHLLYRCFFWFSVTYLYSRNLANWCSTSINNDLQSSEMWMSYYFRNESHTSSFFPIISVMRVFNSCHLILGNKQRFICTQTCIK